jgi:hypothetical protein
MSGKIVGVWQLPQRIILQMKSYSNWIPDRIIGLEGFWISIVMI